MNSAQDDNDKVIGRSKVNLMAWDDVSCVMLNDQIVKNSVHSIYTETVWLQCVFDNGG